MSEATVRRLIAERILPARQFCKGAPWTIRVDDLKLETVTQAADHRAPGSRRLAMRGRMAWLFRRIARWAL